VNLTNLKTHLQSLNNITLTLLLDLSIALVISDTSIKNQVTTSMAHIHCQDKQVIKIIHHVINITTTEAELFVIRCGINQATNLQDISKIIIITDSIHSAKVFKYLLHSYQIHTVAISYELRRFYNSNTNNIIKFWKSLSHCNWFLHKAVDNETKKHHLTSTFLWRVSWEFSKKRGCNNLVKKWKITFQASNIKGQNFLELLDNENNPLELSYSKGGTWLKYFEHSNSLCARSSRTIINHTPIEEYCLKFFPHEDFKCPCGNYPIELRRHILHEYKRFNNYWNLRRDTIEHFVSFLIFNSSAFSFGNSIT